MTVSSEGGHQGMGDAVDGVRANAAASGVTALPGEAQAPTGLGPDGRVSTFANPDEAGAQMRALAADKSKSGEEIREGLAEILRGIDPVVLAQCGIV